MPPGPWQLWPHWTWQAAGLSRGWSHGGETADLEASSSYKLPAAVTPFRFHLSFLAPGNLFINDISSKSGYLFFVEKETFCRMYRPPCHRFHQTQEHKKTELEGIRKEGQGLGAGKPVCFNSRESSQLPSYLLDMSTL